MDFRFLSATVYTVHCPLSKDWISEIARKEIIRKIQIEISIVTWYRLLVEQQRDEELGREAPRPVDLLRGLLGEPGEELFDATHREQCLWEERPILLKRSVRKRAKVS